MFELQPLGRWDITYMNWFPDFADSSDFITDLFGDAPGFPGHFRDADLFRRMRAATRLPDAARHAAFVRLDEDFARAGAAAPFATPVTTDFFSDRIGCQVEQPIYGISLGALCVRK
jgi:ABC-type oligopeptide transport system substrate-binding subunit